LALRNYMLHGAPDSQEEETILVVVVVTRFATIHKRLGGLKLQEWTLTEEIAGVDNTAVDNDGVA